MSAHLYGALVLHGQHTVCGVCGVCVGVCVLTCMEPLYCMASTLCVVRVCMYACSPVWSPCTAWPAHCVVRVCVFTCMEPLYCMASTLCVVHVCVYACSPVWSPCIAWPAGCVLCVCACMRAHLYGALVLHGQHTVCDACVCMRAHLYGALVLHGQHTVCDACVCVCVLTCMEPLYCMASRLCVVRVCVYACSPVWSPCIAWPAGCVLCVCACMRAHLYGALVFYGQHAVFGACVHVCVLTCMEPLYCMASMIRFCSRVRFCSGAFFSSLKFMSF